MMAIAPMKRLSTRAIVRVSAALALAACSSDDGVRVDSIEIVAYGVLEFETAVSGKDPTSSVGAPLSHAARIHVVRQTDRIPLREGLLYGVAFVLRGRPAGAGVPVKVVMRSSRPCVLKQTRQVVYHNDTTLDVRIGDLRHIGAKITSGDDNLCVDPVGPGIETFEFFYQDRKVAEQKFDVYLEDSRTQ